MIQAIPTRTSVLAIALRLNKNHTEQALPLGKTTATHKALVGIPNMLRTLRDLKMKRYGNLYSQICDIENLRVAYENARRGKTKNASCHEGLTKTLFAISSKYNKF